MKNSSNKNQKKYVLAIVEHGFTLERFKEIKVIQRTSGRKEEGRLYINDIIKCDEDMANYLLRDNKNHEAYIRVLEVYP